MEKGTAAIDMMDLRHDTQKNSHPGIAGTRENNAAQHDNNTDYVPEPRQHTSTV